jgi:NADPH:quinone reductase-like Zn-dependent oxidoreductase
MKAVRFDDYGGIEVLEVCDVPRPEPGPDQVLVAVRAAGINPSEAAIRTGRVREIFPATFPSGEGSDLAGVVEGLGAGVKSEGGASAASAATLAELVQAIAAGDLVVPIQRTYPLDDVRAAFTELESGHIAGKIVLIP